MAPASPASEAKVVTYCLRSVCCTSSNSAPTPSGSSASDGRARRWPRRPRRAGRSPGSPRRPRRAWRRRLVTAAWACSAVARGGVVGAVGEHDQVRLEAWSRRRGAAARTIPSHSDGVLLEGDRVDRLVEHVLVRGEVLGEGDVAVEGDDGDLVGDGLGVDELRGRPRGPARSARSPPSTPTSRSRARRRATAGRRAAPPTVASTTSSSSRTVRSARSSRSPV